MEIGPPPRLGTMPAAGGTPRKFFRDLNGQTIIYLTVIIHLSLQKSNDDETNIIPYKILLLNLIGALTLKC